MSIFIFQTADLGEGYMHTETQTHMSEQGNSQTQTSVEDLLLEQIWSHMETQTTSDDFLTGLDFADIETQTSTSVSRSLPTYVSGNSALAHAVVPASNVFDTSVNTVLTQTSRRYTQSNIRLSTEVTASVASTGIQTQALFDFLQLPTDLTDSHTQTTRQNFETTFMDL